MSLSDIVIILCRPSEPGNVGAVCRVMKNMGLSKLRVVAPDSLDEETIITRAIHARDIWDNAVFFDNLNDSISDCSLVIGTTRRRGKNRKSVTIDPRALTERLAAEKGKPAIVFGNERTGLDDEELAMCNIASHIPVSEAFPSINLSHAVQIYAYELFYAFGEIKENLVKGQWIPLNRQAADDLTREITDALAEIGFYKLPGREEQSRFLRDLINRAGLTERESRYLKEIITKAAWMGTMQKKN